MTDINNAIRQYLDRHGFGSFAPKAVLFDMDGVIYNSMPFHAKAWEKSMTEQGIHMTQADAYLYEGMRGVETIKKLFKDQKGIVISDEESEYYYAIKSQYFADQGYAPKMAGVEMLMRQLKEWGMTICVVTGSGQQSLLERLEGDFPGLLHRDLMVTSHDVDHGKPAPDPYLMGLEKCGVLPWEAIVVENAPMGVRAADAARIFTAAVNTGPLPDSMLWEAGASIVEHSMDELRQHLLAWKE